MEIDLLFEVLGLSYQCILVLSNLFSYPCFYHLNLYAFEGNTELIVVGPIPRLYFSYNNSLVLVFDFAD